MAIRGDDPLKIKQRAGHSAFSTTEGYIREAENLAVGFGDAFPSLPAELVGDTERSAQQSNEQSNLPAPDPEPRETDSVSSSGATGDRILGDTLR